MQKKLQDIYAAIEAMEDVQKSKLDTSTENDSQTNSSVMYKLICFFSPLDMFKCRADSGVLML